LDRVDATFDLRCAAAVVNEHLSADPGEGKRMTALIATIMGVTKPAAISTLPITKTSNALSEMKTEIRFCNFEGKVFGSHGS
jgi:hypothetical protein